MFVFVKCKRTFKGLLTLSEIEGDIAIRWVLYLSNVLFTFTTGNDQRNFPLSLNVNVPWGSFTPRKSEVCLSLMFTAPDVNSDIENNHNLWLGSDIVFASTFSCCEKVFTLIFRRQIYIKQLHLMHKMQCNSPQIALFNCCVRILHTS